jgi:hypothetical protein
MAERPNRTIMEAAEAMRYHAGLGPNFWGDAVQTSVYLYNRFQHNAINFTTPYNCWFGKKPNMGHIRVFGCKGQVHQQTKHQVRLTP